MSNTAKNLEQATKEEDVDLSRYLPQRLNQVVARMNERLAEELRTLDLPLPQWRIIAILKWRGSCTLKEIREWTVIDLSTASRAVKRLEEQGHVTRDWDAQDARAREIRLTPKGMDLYQQAWPIVSGFHTYVFGDMEQGESDAMLGALKNALDRMGKSVWSG